MSAKLEIEIRPKVALTKETQAIQRLYARVVYTHEVPNPELDRSGKQAKPLEVPTATTGELAANGTLTLVAEDNPWNHLLNFRAPSLSECLCAL